MLLTAEAFQSLGIMLGTSAVVCPATRARLRSDEQAHRWAAELHFRTDPALRPLRDAAHRLAELEEWTPLYDEAALAANSVPTFAMVYESDLYVDTHHSLGTSARVGAVRTCLSADHAHYILSAFGPVVFNHLLAMARIEC